MKKNRARIRRSTLRRSLPSLRLPTTEFPSQTASTCILVFGREPACVNPLSEAERNAGSFPGIRPFAGWSGTTHLQNCHQLFLLNGPGSVVPLCTKVFVFALSSEPLAGQPPGQSSRLRGHRALASPPKATAPNKTKTPGKAPAWMESGIGVARDHRPLAVT